MQTPRFEILKVLIAAAETPSLTEAALSLGISQAAVSMKLKELESSVPIPVFGLEGKRKRLTHYGRALYAMAREQKELLEGEFAGLSRAYASAEHLTLKVACRREVFEIMAPRLIFAGRVEFFPMSSHEAVQALLNHSVDLAISYERPDSNEIHFKKVLESGPKFVVHQKWLAKSKLTLPLVKQAAFLYNTPCVLYQRDGHMLSGWIDYLKLDFNKMKIKMVLQDWRTIQAMVDQGYGYAIVPKYIEHGKDVSSLMMPQAILRKIDYYALFHKDLRQIKAFQKLLEFSQDLSIT